jgi:hypothetical protein
MGLLAELKRRNVYKVAVAYAIVGWLLVQVATQVFPFLEIPNWVVRLVIAIVVIGFPIALVIAWAFEATPQGIKRTEDVDLTAGHVSKKHAWIYIVIVGALLSVGLFMLGRYGFREKNSASSELPAKSIAVLPFVNMSADKNDEYLSDGVSEELITALSKITGLQVKARTSSFAFKGKNEDIQKAASPRPAISCALPRSSSRPRTVIIFGRTLTTARCRTSLPCAAKSLSRWPQR